METSNDTNSQMSLSPSNLVSSLNQIYIPEEVGEHITEEYWHRCRKEFL